MRAMSSCTATSATATLLDRLFAEHRPRAVVHFAAESHVDRSIHGPGTFVQTNVNGTFTLLEAARGFWSTLRRDRARGVPLPPRLDRRGLRLARPGRSAVHRDQHLYEPNSPYSASKAASDHLVRAWHHTYGLPVLTTNCSNNYGPFHFPEKLIPLMIVNALAGKPLPVYGDGQQVRDWLYVKDHCAAIREVLARGRVGETYNVGGWNEKPNIEIVHTVCALLDELQPDPAGSYARLISLRHRPAGPRPPLCDRCPQARARTRLEAGRDLRDRHPQDRAVVPRQPRLGRSACRAAPTATGSSATTPTARRPTAPPHEDPAVRLQRPGRLGIAARTRAIGRGGRPAHPQHRACGRLLRPGLAGCDGARDGAADHRQCRRAHRGRPCRERARSGARDQCRRARRARARGGRQRSLAASLQHRLCLRRQRQHALARG